MTSLTDDIVEGESEVVNQTWEKIFNPGAFFHTMQSRKKKPMMQNTVMICLHQAARDGELIIVKQHIRNIGKDKKKLNKKDKDHWTPLHYAVRYGHFEIVMLLVEHGANVNSKGENEDTPLHYAARYAVKDGKSTIGYFSGHFEDPGQKNNTTDDLEAIKTSSSCYVVNSSLSMNDENIILSNMTHSKEHDMLEMDSYVKNDNLDSQRLLEKTSDKIGEIPMESSILLPQICSQKVELHEESILKYLLDQKANINARNRYHLTPLHFAAMKNNVVAARVLLQAKNLDIEAKNRTKMTALHTACSSGAYEVCVLLLDNDANIRCQDEENMTPLHFAAMEGHLNIVQLLFEVGDKRGGYMMLAKMIMDQDRDDQTALHLAVINGYSDIVKLCLSKGANVNFVKANMMTPLHLACISGQIEIVEFLIDSEANVCAQNVFQETPLHRAAMFNKVKVVKLLIDNGANIDCKDKDKETPLMMAVRKNNMETVNYLISCGADFTAKDVQDRTCLHIAAEDDYYEVMLIFQKLSNSKEFFEEKDKKGNTPLHIACEKGNNKVVDLLLSMGLSIDQKNDQNLTPLHLACKYGRTRIVKMLLEGNNNNSIVNDEDDCSNTPLHVAAMEGHENVMSCLLEHGADVDARNAAMFTPLDCAASRGWTWCAELLIDSNSLIDPTDKGNTTPLHLASMEGHVDMIQLLLMEKKADIARKDHRGRNCLDFAIDNNQKMAAITILKSENWKSALKNFTIEGKKVTTPMRKLIKKMPDVAEIVFNKCIEGNGLHPDHPSYEISCSYEFLEDSITDWGPSDFDLDSKSPMEQTGVGNVGIDQNVQLSTPMSCFARIGKNLRLPGCVERRSERKRNHVLKLMVRNERTVLLSHPLVTYLLRHKWRSVGRYFYYSKLFFYIVYLIFITGYVLTCMSNNDYAFNQNLCNSTNNSEYKVNSTNSNHSNNCGHMVNVVYIRVLFIDVGNYIVLVIAIVSLFFQLLKFFSQLIHFFSPYNLIECVTYAVAILVINNLSDCSQNSRNDWHINLGAFTVWLSWMNFLLFIRRFPKLGIYVVMFTDIFKTFVQFFIVFILFIVAFGLAFYVLLHKLEPKAFRTPQRSMLKTTMGMLGEFEYDSVFNNREFKPISMAWAIYVAYLAICCIILMNLLVGLAVDDIKGVQEQAALERLAMLVDLTLNVEKTLPLSIQKRLVKTTEKIQPNAVKGWSFWSFWTLKAPKMRSNHSSEEQLAMGGNKCVLESITSLKTKIKNLEAQNIRLEEMLKVLLKHNGLEVDSEADKRPIYISTKD